VDNNNAIFANAAVVHHSSTQPDAAAPAPAPAPTPSSRGTQRRSTPAPAPAPATDGRKYVNAKTITNPVEITVKGKKRWIYPSTFSSEEKDEFLGQHSNPKKKMKCRAGIHYNETTGAYQQCLQEHYTEEHAKLHPEQAAAKQVVLEAAGPWRDYHPLAGTNLSVDEDEWNSRAQAGHFPPCSQLDYFEEPQEQHVSVQEVVQDFRRVRRRNRISFSTDDTIENDTEPSSATEAAPTQAFDSSQDEVVLFVACLFLFLACTWIFGSFTIFVTPMSTAIFTPTDSTTVVATWTPTVRYCTLQSCFVLHSALTIVACGLVLTLRPSLIVTILTWLQIRVTVQPHPPAIVTCGTDSQPLVNTVPAVPEAQPVTPRRLPSSRSTSRVASDLRQISYRWQWRKKLYTLRAIAIR
jgi:hypothetical protein